jgi:glycosyltransferase involved in cell wall biosynthesis
VSDVLVDVTQFTREPARSGIQRAIGEMARAWPSGAATLFVARFGDRVLGIPPGRFADVVEGFFGASDTAAGAARVHSAFAAGAVVPRADLDAARWLLPEPTYDWEVLDDLGRRCAGGQHVSAVVFDCFPQTHPWAFAGNGQAATSGYFRFLARVPVAVATSAEVGETLVNRLRRDPASTPVAVLGTDHVPSRPGGGVPVRGRFLVVGTVEPRKRFNLALDAVTALQVTVPFARLVVVGRPGWAEPSFLRRLRRASEAGEVVDWRSDARDDELVELMASATALLALGDEGFGLPVAEALKQGCPVVYGGVQPAARLADGRGAWRVDTSSAVALATALEPWCDRHLAQERRAMVDASALPTWRAFSLDVLASLMGD